jgi:hypothetical protein|tara:strand:- start:1868 stop:2647 length:780 start_codon:yes stop_codon:yes gene_type:complete
MKPNKPILSDDYRHSASRGNDYISNPSLWLMRNYFREESEMNYSMAMGIASEVAAHAGITMSDCNVSDLAVIQFKTVAEEALKKDEDWTHNGVIPKQMDKVSGIAENFVSILKTIDKELVHYNKKYIVEHETLKHKISYVPDFEYEDLIIDTKATQAFPTDPFKTKMNHIRQVSLYGVLSGKDVALLYATDKKCALFGIPDQVVKREGEFMLQAFEKIEKNNDLFKDAKEFMKYNILNTEGYQWDENTRQRANRYWAKA